MGLFRFGEKSRAALRETKEKEWQQAKADYDRRYRATLQAKARQITDAVPSPLPELGFQNFPGWIVMGKKKTTNRMNKVYVRAKSKDVAALIAKHNKDLVGSLEIVPASFLPASGINDYGIVIPKGACQEDEMLLINSILAHDDFPMTSGFMSYATAHNIPLSWLQGRNSAATKVLNAVGTDRRLMLYAYAIDCSLRKVAVGNMLKAPRLEQYEAFVEAAKRDPKVVKSILSRPGSDMWAPVKTTIAYQFASKFFG